MFKIKMNTYKILLLGDCSSGKTCLLNRFVNDNYEENTSPTKGIVSKVRTIDLDGKIIKLQIWDPPGSDRHHEMGVTSYNKPIGYMLVYDITDFKSFNNIEFWIENITEKKNSNPSIKTLVGTKCDISRRKVDTARALALAKKYGMNFMEVSAKTNENIIEVFIQLAHKIKDLEDLKRKYPF